MTTDCENKAFLNSQQIVLSGLDGLELRSSDFDVVNTVYTKYDGAGVVYHNLPLILWLG